MQTSKKKTTTNKDNYDGENENETRNVKKVANYDSNSPNVNNETDEVIYLDPKEQYRMSTTNPQTDLRKTITISGANRGRSPGTSYMTLNSSGSGGNIRQTVTGTGNNNNLSNNKYEEGTYNNNPLNSSLNNITTYYSRNNNNNAERSPVGRTAYKDTYTSSYNVGNNNNVNNIQTISYGTNNGEGSNNNNATSKISGINVVSGGNTTTNNNNNLRNPDLFNTINYNNRRIEATNNNLNNNLLFTNPNMYSYMQPNNNFNNFNENTYSIIRNDRSNYVPNEGTFNTLNNTFTNNYGYGQNTFYTRNNNLNLNENTVDINRANDGYYNYYMNSIPNNNGYDGNNENVNFDYNNVNRSPILNRSPIRNMEIMEDNYNTNLADNYNLNNNNNNNLENNEIVEDNENIHNNNVTVHIDNPEINRNKIDEIRRLNAYYNDNFVNRHNNMKVIRITEETNERENEENDKVNELYDKYSKDIDKLKELGFGNRLVLARHSRIFNKTREEGRLLNKTTHVYTALKPISDENLNNRGGVIKKFKKLSSVLLSKSQKPGSRGKSSMNLNTVDEDGNEDDYDTIKNNLRESKSVDNKYDGKTDSGFNKSYMGKGRIFTGQKTNFIRITMAMLSSKGPFCEDRIITRDMRFDKGGVVDLAQKQNKKDEKYKIKKVLGTRSPQGKDRYRYTQRDREKAAKICQLWWRNILGKYKSLLDKIVKIQSFWRSKWMKMNMVDIIYATTLLNTFQKMVFKVIRRHKLREGMNELLKFGDKYSARLYLTFLVRVQRYMKNWLDILRDKRRRLGNQLEIIFERRKRRTFDELKDYADYRKKVKDEEMEKLKDFVAVSKKNTRKAIFHDMFKELLLEKPKRQFRSAKVKSSLNSKTKTERFFIENILRKRFLHWAKVAHVGRLVDDHSNDDSKEKKYYALIQIITNGERLAKKRALEVTIPPILRYLYDILRQRMTKNLVLTNSKLSKIALRAYFNKWNKKVDLIRQKEVRNNFFASLAEKSGSKIRVKFLRKYFMRWYRTKPKDQELKFYLASEKLRNGINRLQIKKPIMAFKEKIALENAKSGMQHAFGLKDKYIKRHWREYFYRWFKAANFLKSQEQMELLAFKIMGGFSVTYKKRLLQKWFSHWKKTPKINLTDVYNRFKHMLDFVEKLKVYNRKLQSPPLLEHLKNNNDEFKQRKGLRSAVKKRKGKDDLLLKAYFWNWRTRARKLSEIELQQAIGSKFIKNWHATQDRFNLYKHFMRWFNNVQRAKIMENRTRGQALYDVLDKKYRLPFEKLKLASKWIGIISKLREACPKVHAALTRTFVPPKLRKWHNNVIGFDQDRMGKMSEWMKNMQGEEYEARLRAKNKLFLKHFARLDKQFELKKIINLKKWKKNTKIVKFEKAAEKIQAVQRGIMVRDRKQIEEQREKLRNLITRVFNINILYKMQEVNDFIRPLKHNLSEVTAQYENRRITNNMISVSNNALRNSYLEKLTGKKCFSADSMSLRYRFNLWKRIGDKMNNHAILLQKNFRKMQARNKADRLLEIKERLYSLALRNEESAKGKLKLALRLWNAKANHLKMLEDAIKIRRFCRSVVAKDDNDNFKKTFVDWSKKITDRRLNNAAKVNNLKDTLRKIYAKIILERVDKKDKRDKFTDLMRKFAKGLNDKEDTLKKKNNLRSMFRMYFIKKLQESCVEPAKMVKSRYLIRLAFMHKNINDKRTYRELIRKWKFYVMMSKFLKKKSEHVYKQMHINYLNIVNNLLGNGKADGFGNGSLYSETENLAKGMGLFKFADPNLVTYNENDGDYNYEKVKKQYKFKHIQYNNGNNEEENIDEDESPDVYSNQNNNNYNTTGRYKEDTVKTTKSKK